jgi:hypothetical protein
VLAQRAAFLRPDSSVAIVILTDEDDASLKPAGLNWLPFGSGKGKMLPGWSSCASVPDDFEPDSLAEYSQLHADYSCKSCFEDSGDPACSKAWPTTSLDTDVDGRSVRAFHMTQRFGYNFLWGRDRYIKALTDSTVVGSDGSLGQNPLFGTGERTKGNIFFAAIVGVPSALVTNDDGSPKVLGATAWEKIVSPDPTKRDPHMLASIAPRAGIPKFAGDRSVDPINGGDRDISDGDDLQYACIGQRAISTPTTDCTGALAAKNPLCSSGSQPFFKAYPSLRILRVARAMGARGFVGSICTNTQALAMDAIADRLQPLIR